MTPAHPRAARLAYYLLPSLFCLAVHWQGLRTWFLQDDFAWLRMAGSVHGWSDLARALFEPQAQGTVRVFSERLFFLTVRAIFGLHSLPFHAVVFFTQFVNLALLAAIARRLTGSALAGFVAPILWTASAALATPLFWISAYNEILCAYCVLTAFYCLLRHVETGDWRFLLAQWVVFLIGFGVLEVIAVYPALAALYTLLFARRYFRTTLPLFLPSAIFTAVHALYIPRVASPIYRLYFDASIAETLWRYVLWALGTSRLDEALGDQWLWPGLAAAAIIGLSLGGFALWQLGRRQWLPAFAIGWFVLFVAPVLPLANHLSDYYLTLPMIGLAILGAWAFAAAWDEGRAARGVAMLLGAFYLAGSIVEIHAATDRPMTESNRMHGLFRAVEAAHAQHPDRMVLLAGVDSPLFEAGFQDHPFRLFGAEQVYLAPGSGANFNAREDLGGIEPFLIPLEAAANAVESGKADVLEIAGDRTRVVTERYAKVLRAEYLAQFRSRVDVGDPRFATRLGSGWYPIENGFRWMSKRASVTLGGPDSPGRRLVVTGYAPAVLMKGGPLTLTASVAGSPLATAKVTEADKLVTLRFPLPDTVVGKYSFEVELEVNRTFTPPGDERPLGLTFGVLEIK